MSIMKTVILVSVAFNGGFPLGIRSDSDTKLTGIEDRVTVADFLTLYKV